jgi:hypothetical protein
VPVSVCRFQSTYKFRLDTVATQQIKLKLSDIMMLDLKRQNLHFIQIEKIKKAILPSPRSGCRIHHTEGSRGAERPSRRHLHEEPNRRRKRNSDSRRKDIRVSKRSPALQASLPAPRSVDVGTLFTEKAYKFSEGFLQFFGCVNEF